MMNRATKNFVVNYFQNKGAKVHFNYGIKMIDEELAQQTGEPEEVIVSLLIINKLGCPLWRDTV
jgi:hypothetical protein